MEMIPRRILVIDDNVHAADTLAVILRHWGHDVRVAYDGPEGLDVASEFLPQTVILDIEMPAMNGFEVACHLRERPDSADLALIALTAHDLRDMPRGCDAAHFNHHLRKPLNFSQLTRVLSRPAVPGIAGLKG